MKIIKVLIEKILTLKLNDTKIIIIDDNSPDGTGEIAESLSDKFKNKTTTIHRAGKLDLGLGITVDSTSDRLLRWELG